MIDSMTSEQPASRPSSGKPAEFSTNRAGTDPIRITLSRGAGGAIRLTVDGDRSYLRIKIVKSATEVREELSSAIVRILLMGALLSRRTLFTFPLEASARPGKTWRPSMRWYSMEGMMPISTSRRRTAVVVTGQSPIGVDPPSFHPHSLDRPAPTTAGSLLT